MRKELILILILFLNLVVFAQRSEDINERIKIQKTAFITEKLHLTEEEAAKFWPIYNDIDSKKRTLRKTSRLKISAKNISILTENEAKYLLQEILDLEDKKHQFNRELVSKLSGVISNKKIIQLAKAERDFDKKLLKRLKEFRGKRTDKN